MRSQSAAAMLGMLFVLGTVALVHGQTVSELLAPLPQFSSMKRLLETSGVMAEIESRSSETLLLLENPVIDGFVAGHPSYTPQMFADVLRFHVLLQYFDAETVATSQINGGSVTTLLQTTGRYNGLDGFISITAAPDGVAQFAPASGSQVVRLRQGINKVPYVYSLFQVDTVIEPLNLAAGQLAPASAPSVAPVPAPDAVPVAGPAAEVPVAAPTPDVPLSPVPAPATITTPVPAPTTVKPPVKAPVSSPAGKAPALSPSEPQAASSAVSGRNFSVAAVVASVFLALFFL